MEQGKIFQPRPASWDLPDEHGKGRVYVSREYASEITATDAETLVSCL